MSLPSAILIGGVALATGLAVRAPAPAVISLSVSTIHAAALSTSRNPADVGDAPFLLATVLGPGAARGALRLPATAQFHIKENEAVGAQSLTSLALQPGDSVRVLLSLMEGGQVSAAEEAQASSAVPTALRVADGARVDALRRALAPLTDRGANWLGSVTVLLTNEGGTVYWRGFQCVATCSVLTAPGAGALGASAPQAAVAEFSGAGGTYHMQLQAAMGAPPAR